MSTYTDLKNTLKETINVDYKTRATNLEVVLINKNNVFYGKFEGEITAHKADLSNSVISDTLIRNCTLSNVVLYGPDGKIDLGNVVTELQSLSNDIHGTDGAFERIDKCDIDIRYLSGEISSIASGYYDFKQEVNEKIDYLSATISSEIDNRISADNALYNKVHDEVLSAHKLRKEGDEALLKTISLVSSFISSEITSQYDSLLSTIDYEKHFKLVKMNHTSNPLKAKEFAVNELVDYTLAEAIVQYKHEDVGRISKDQSTENGYFFDVFDKISFDLLDVLQPGDHLSFKPGVAFDVKFGWFCIFKLVEGKWNCQACPKAGDFWTVEIDGLTAGTITNYTYTDDLTKSKFKSGYLEILLTKYATKHSFDIDDPESLCWSVINEFGEHRYTFLPETNNFLIDFNITDKKYAELYNSLSGDRKFGIVRYANTKVVGETLISTIAEIDTGKNVELTQDNNFYVDYRTLDGKLVNVSCDPSDIKNATLDVTEKHLQYKYNVLDGSEIKIVLSSDENTLLSDILPNGKIYADLKNAKLRSKFKNVYTLSCVGGNSWEYQEGDSEFEDSLRIELNLIENTLHIVATYKDDEPSSVDKPLNIDPIPTLFNPGIEAGTYTGKALYRVYSSNPFDLTFTSPKTKSDKLPEYSTYCRPGVSHTGGDPKIFDTVEGSSTEIKILIPEKVIPNNSDISRVFDFVFKVTSPTAEKVEIVFVDTLGNKLKYYDNHSKNVFIPTNKFTTLELKEVRDDKFLVIDLNLNSQEERIDDLYKKLSSETSARISVDTYLSSEISSNKKEIDDIWKNIRGGLCYKDNLDLCCVEDIHLKPNSVLSNLFGNNFLIKGYAHTCQEVLSVKLREGWYYVAEVPEHQHLTVDGLEIENKDWIVISRNCEVSSITSAFVNILDAQDSDNFRLSANNIVNGNNTFYGKLDIFNLSAKNAIINNLEISGMVSVDNIGVQGLSALCSYISTLTADIVSIETGISVSSDKLYLNDKANFLSNIIDSIELSVSSISSRIGKVELSIDNISNDISSLSSRLSSDILNKYTYLSSEISSNDNDISYLSSELSDYHNTLSGIDRNEHRKEFDTCNIATDNLMITNMDWISDPSPEKGHHDKYFLTMLSGTLVLKKI